MPSRERVTELIRYVVNLRFLEALNEFYHEDVAMQENDEEPRIGLDQNMKRDEMFLNIISEFHQVKARSYIVDGDVAAIRWTPALSRKQVFLFRSKDELGRNSRLSSMRSLVRN